MIKEWMIKECDGIAFWQKKNYYVLSTVKTLIRKSKYTILVENAFKTILKKEYSIGGKVSFESHVIYTLNLKASEDFPAFSQKCS